MNKNLKEKILERNNTYNFYKTEYYKYKSAYKNLINNINKKSHETFLKQQHLSQELEKIKKEQEKFQSEAIINNILVDINESKYNELITKLKINNLKLSSEIKYLNKIINNIYEQNKILSNSNNDLICSKQKNNQNIVEYYKKEIDFYKNQCEYLMERQNEYNLLINKLLNSNLNDICKKQRKINQVHNLNICKNLNIAYILQGFPTLSQTFVHNELRWLKQQGFNIKVFTYDNPQKPIKLDFELEVIRFDGNLLENLETLLIEHNINLIHTHFVYPVGTNLTFPLAEKLKIPFTIFAHAYDIFSKAIDKINNISEIANSQYCKCIFTLSEFHKKYLIERNVPNNKIIITRQATYYNISPIQKKSNKIKNIVSISRFVEKKGIDTLISAAKLLKNENLTFSIYGYGILEEELKEQIFNLNIKNVSIKKDLSPQETINVLKNSDLLVSPCKIAKNGDMDGIPTIILEAMAYGLPVLTTNISAIPEIIKDYENGFIINPNDPIMLSNKIKEIISLPSEKLFEIEKNAQRDVQNYSSIEKTMKTYINKWSDN